MNVTVQAGASTVESVAGEQPVVKGLFWVSGATGWTFNNVDVTWPTSGATSSDQMVRIRNAHDWRYTGSDIGNAHSTAAFGLNSTVYSFRIDHNRIHDTVPSNGTNQDHLVYVETAATAIPGGVGTIDRNVLVGSPNGRAIKIGLGSGSTAPTGGVNVQYNTMVDNYGPSNVQLSYGAANNLFSRNLMDGSSAQNITRYMLAGVGNAAKDNVGWHSTAVLDVGPGLTDQGGNLHIDPQLDGNYVPQNPNAQAYGYAAP